MLNGTQVMRGAVAGSLRNSSEWRSTLMPPLVPPTYSLNGCFEQQMPTGADTVRRRMRSKNCQPCMSAV